MKPAITIHATRNETKKPVPVRNNSLELRCNPDFKIEYPVAATIVGIARKKENSTATIRDEPSIIAPIIVAADLEVPGIMARH